ncbi:CocE/NonD family hydrolase [Methanospirillum hungatei]|uniref:CocE/NonD family hydrolase n=1 Tax=Methanospirillum hungatei TaxID=2203 RepID=UPI0026EA8981|nr:CocE/NonD family hydrolase [Methanospirillum hungatei]MCA1915181.1 CocE/NonD family hydrolase [Methanospirillum hungatei]
MSPVLFEMDPCRMDDVSYLEDYYVGMYFAKRGYVVAMVDVRWTGRSDGVVPDREYSEQELSDGVEIIDLLAGKEWSSGNGGMSGMSWSGFNALMIAGRKPPA